MKRRFAWLGRFAITAAVVCAALGVGGQLWNYYMEAPWTRDGRVRADVVQMAPDVSGLVSKVLVRDNQTVRRGDVLFRIDRARFALALEQAEATIAGRRAALDEATADLKRYEALSTGVVSEQKKEQITTAQLQAKAAMNRPWRTVRWLNSIWSVARCVRR